MVKIRLTRLGKHKSPFYRVIVTDSKARRDGPFIEILGTYAPLLATDSLKIDAEKAKYWLGQGAQPTVRARKLLKKVGVEAA